MKALLCKDGPDELCRCCCCSLPVTTTVLRIKFIEARVAATFMYPAYNKHSGAASNCRLLL